MNPDALFVANEYGDTPFDHALASSHEWAVEQFQWKLSIEQIESSSEKLDNASQKQLHDAVKRKCESMLELTLPHDCAYVVCEYAFTNVQGRGVNKKRNLADLSAFDF